MDNGTISEWTRRYAFSWIAELSFPGTWLACAGISGDEAFQIEEHFSGIERLLEQWGVALAGYEAAMHQSELQRRNRMERREEGSCCASSSDSRPRSIAEHERILSERQRSANRKRWEKGQRPSSLVWEEYDMYSRSAVYCMMQIVGNLTEICKSRSCPQRVRGVLDELARLTPDARLVRNSLEHTDERMAEFGPAGTKVNSLPSGGSFTGIHGYYRRMETVKDGSARTVAFGPETLDRVRQLVQDAIDAFAWTGSPCWKPS